jgi:glucokinase
MAGIDVGGTNIKIGLVDDLGRTLAYRKLPTEQEKGTEDAARRMGDCFRQLLQEADLTVQDVARVGLATPGPLDIPTGMLLTPGNLPQWWNIPIRDRVSQECGQSVTYANDANAAAYGEYWCGVGRGSRSMVLFTLGTGIGGGIIVDGMLVDGAHSTGSECGHIVIDPRPEARRDSLDKPGTLEAYCGAYGVVARAIEAIDVGRKSTLEVQRTNGDPITPLVIARAAEAGDALAREIVLETADYLALACVSLIHVIDPDRVVLGGAMTFGGAQASLGREFLERIRQAVPPRLLPPLRGQVQIDFATLGGDAGYIGAAGLARLDHQAHAN